jgi:UDP-N-acetylglucosamine:LPS N-acetylglucosamine transferase
MPEKSNLKYEIGPSLRYSKVFTTQINKEEQRDILVFLPYFKEEIESIIRIIKDGIAFSRQVFVKAHPATTIAKYRSIFPSNVNIVNKDSYKLFKEAKIIISNASGTLIEASSLGIPVIFVKNSSSLEYNNPLPEYGRGIIWEEATDCEELNNKIVEFEESLNYKAEEINAIASAYKQMFFCEPTEENIIKAFDLLSQ